MPRLHRWEQPLNAESLPAAGGQDSQETASGSQQQASNTQLGKKRSWASSQAEGHGNAVEQPEGAEEAGAALGDLLLELHVSGRLTAKHACLISHYAHKAGACGPVAQYGYKPGAPSGHYQRHLDKAAGLRDQNLFYHMTVPCFSKRSRSRVSRQLDVLPPHECLHREFEDNPSLTKQLHTAELPQSFDRHPVALAAAGPVLPVALYMDGVQYTKVGASVIVFAVVNLLSGSRHMIRALDKKYLCRCGCRGWCTLQPIMAFLRWSIGVMATGRFPDCDHFGKTWEDCDATRFASAQSPLAFGSAAVQQVRGDWAEFSHTLGFPTWHSSDHPCIWCRADREMLYNWDFECELMDHSAYDQACAKCEIWVQFATQESLIDVAKHLYYDKRTYGHRGRCLNQSFPELGLLKGDRVEPSYELQDVSRFEEQAAPCRVLFWRATQETSTRHRNPLFDPAIGVTVQSIKVDSLHCLALGVWQAVLSPILAAIVAEDIYGAAKAGATTVESREHHTFQEVTVELSTWAAKHKTFTQVQTELSLPIRLKGAETKTLLYFMKDKFAAGFHRKLEKGGVMQVAVEALVRNYECISRPPLVWPKDAQEEIGTPLKQFTRGCFTWCGDLGLSRNV